MIPTRVKLIAQAIIPQVLLQYFRQKRIVKQVAACATRASMFEGEYASFEAAARDCKGYDDAGAATSASRRMSELKTGNNPIEIDGRFQQVHSALCVIRDRLNTKTISVLDVGGGNGSYYFRLKQLFPTDTLKWHVVETESMVAACQPIGTPEVSYSTERPTDQFDVVLISGALQYLPDPYESLKRFSSAGNWMILTRLPVHDRTCDRIMKQVVPAHIHSGSMPIWIFDASNFRNVVEATGKIELSWSVPLDDGALSQVGARAVGFLVNLAFGGGPIIRSEGGDVS
jgi:putative methyltransferase (TIGR04325 family)